MILILRLYPLVATVLTACGIETLFSATYYDIDKLQQYLPLAVLKQFFFSNLFANINMLQQYLPLAVLKQFFFSNLFANINMLQQYLPLAVLKLSMKSTLE